MTAIDLLMPVSRQTATNERLASGTAPIPFSVLSLPPQAAVPTLRATLGGGAGDVVLSSIGGRLFAPFKCDHFVPGGVVPVAGDTPEEVEAHLRKVRDGAHASRLIAVLSHRAPTGRIRTGHPWTTLDERVSASAADDFAFVGGRLHRSCGEPSWMVSRRGYAGGGDLRAGNCLMVPNRDTDGDYHAVRHDRIGAAEAILAAHCRHHPSQRMEPLPDGSVLVLDPSYSPSRDDLVELVRRRGRQHLTETEVHLASVDRGMISAWCEMRDGVYGISEGRPAAEAFAAGLGRFVEGATRSKDALPKDLLYWAKKHREAFARFALELELAVPAPGPMP